MPQPVATITMEYGARLVVELCPDAAPNTVNSFIYLANLGCYDNYAIRRIVPGYVVDISYTAFDREECKYLIARETRSQGIANNIRMEPGVIGMGGYEQGIAGGEFFFPLGFSEKIDGIYPGFGYVREGWAEVEKWAAAQLRPVVLPHSPQVAVNEPVTPIVISKVRVETFGVNYPLPQKLEQVELPAGW